MTEWRPVLGWEKYYEVSDDGQVRSLDRLVHRRHTRPYVQRGRIMATHQHEFGYPMVDLKAEGRKVTRTVHALLLEAFTGPAPEGLQCRHRNGDPTDCRLENLRWGTPAENMADKRDHGTMYQLNKRVCREGHRLAEPNLVQARLPKRICLTCAATSKLRSRHPDLTDDQVAAWSAAKYEAVMSGVRRGRTGRAVRVPIPAPDPARTGTDAARAGTVPGVCQ